MSLIVKRQNFHVPLSKDLYRELRSEARRRRIPATILARQAIEAWIENRRAEALHTEIAAYTTRHAGTAIDLDKDLERAGLEILKATSRTSTPQGRRKAGKDFCNRSRIKVNN
jgi:hypothetical protein